MDEITVDEEDMGEIDPLAAEVSPSDESGNNSIFSRSKFMILVVYIII